MAYRNGPPGYDQNPRLEGRTALVARVGRRHQERRRIVFGMYGCSAGTTEFLSAISHDGRLLVGSLVTLKPRRNLCNLAFFLFCPIANRMKLKENGECPLMRKQGFINRDGERRPQLSH